MKSKQTRALDDVSRIVEIGRKQRVFHLVLLLSTMFSMRSLFLLCVALLACASHAFEFAPRSVLTSRIVRNPVSKILAVKPAASGIPEGYWEGDWVCADCGYVFDKDIDGGGKYFEDQKKGFICPQCRCEKKSRPVCFVV